MQSCLLFVASIQLLLLLVFVCLSRHLCFFLYLFVFHQQRHHLLLHHPFRYHYHHFLVLYHCHHCHYYCHLFCFHLVYYQMVYHRVVYLHFLGLDLDLDSMDLSVLLDLVCELVGLVVDLMCPRVRLGLVC